MRILPHAGASADIESSTAWYEERREGLGEEFLEEVSRAFEAIASSLGVDAEVVGVGMTEEEEIVGVCRRGREKARLSILDPRATETSTRWMGVDRGIPRVETAAVMS